jgi:pimeloyl-ACP methyl ester carboxylesterase
VSIRYAQCGDLELAYETFGSAQDPTVMLVMGLGSQMVAWADEFCTMIADEGFQVVRFDNRDVGLSTHFDSAGTPNLTRVLLGRPIKNAPYLLADMADDTVRLADALEVDRMHVVGVSMGGMIAQEIALRHAPRVLSLTSIMSTTAPAVGPPRRRAAAALLMRAPRTEAEAGARSVAVFKVIGSPGYPLDEAGWDARGREAFRRANDPAGRMRHLAAIHASGDRTERLRDLRVPTLVLHGEDDPLVRIEGGRATAAAVPGARLITYPGMGHDLPAALWPQVVHEIAEHARTAAENRR